MREAKLDAFVFDHVLSSDECQFLIQQSEARSHFEPIHHECALFCFEFREQSLSHGSHLSLACVVLRSTGAHGQKSGYSFWNESQPDAKDFRDAFTVEVGD